MYPKYIVFDFDGTILKSEDGILACAQHAMREMGYRVPNRQELLKFIGPPLHAAFHDIAGMDDETAETAVRIYRERYSSIGLFEAQVYPGIAPLLRGLKADGRYLAIASAKPDAFVKRIVEHFRLSEYFDYVLGADMSNHSSDKRSLIRATLPENVNPDEVCMVGDRCYDIDAGRDLGFHTVAVEYGYGSREEFIRCEAEQIAETVEDLGKILGAPIQRGKMISFEGSDGCGKSTQIRLLRDFLTNCGGNVIVSREPGGCPISEKIREIILSLDSKGMSAECEALLYAASRVEHVKETILPALESGKIVLCDRYLDSSFAYQAFGRELGEDFIRQINRKAAELVMPDKTLLFTLSRADAVKRMDREGIPLDRLELEKEDFFRRVDAGFETLARENPERIRKIDSGKSIEEVFQEVLQNI